MSSGLRIWGACRGLALRARPAVVTRPRAEVFWHARQTRAARRFYSDDANRPPAKPADTPESRTIPDAAQKASDLKILQGQITQDGDNRVAEDPSLQAGDAAADSYIDSIDDSILEQLLPAGNGGNGGLTPAQEEMLYNEGTIPSPEEAEARLLVAGEGEAEGEAVEEAQLEAAEPGPVESESVGEEVQNAGHKFGIPQKPFPDGFHLRKRYHPVLEQITRLLMRDGKLSVAQTHMTAVMNYLRTSPAPVYNKKVPLLPGTPPAPFLPLNPILYITVAIDSVAPIVRVRSLAGAGGGGRALDLPMPIGLRQRRRMAFRWILDAIDKKQSKGSGRRQLSKRIADEIIAVVEGRSGIWDKRKQIHKLSTAARANVTIRSRRRSSRGGGF
ncbi:hypothetical protein CDD83_10387 [Cordyceps sp. RAO-2017]|nr:hypothetical protein CDD83_10387 [Cordyceps sp. RAO-2017]